MGGDTTTWSSSGRVRQLFVIGPEHGDGRDTFLNVGCIPTKMFVPLADKVTDAEDSAPLGVSVDGVRSKWAGIPDRIFGRTVIMSSSDNTYRKSRTDHSANADAHRTDDENSYPPLPSGRSGRRAITLSR